MGRIQGDLLQRSFEFALDILKLTKTLPHETAGWVVGKQLVRSGTSIGANIREADGALTVAQFASFCSITRREASETQYWLELCIVAGMIDKSSAQNTLQECGELCRILTTIVKKIQSHQKASKA